MSEQQAESDVSSEDSVEPLLVDVHPPSHADRHTRLVLSGALTGRTAALARDTLHSAVGTHGPWLVLDVDRLTRAVARLRAAQAAVILCRFEDHR